MRKKLLLSIFLFSFAFSTTTYYVDGTNGLDTNSGTSGLPFASLSYAVSSAVDGDSIIVKAGTYTGSSNRNIGILKKIIIKSESGAATTILDAEQTDRHFYFNNWTYPVDSTFKLIGFTLKNGKPTTYNHGGSIYISNNSNPVFDSCIFESNQTYHASANSWKSGGAIYMQNGAPIIRDCTFKNNSTDTYGGAIYISNHADTIKTVIERTTFYGNEVTPYPNAPGYGGAIHITGSPQITDCVFDSNLVKMNSDWNNYGGAIYLNSTYVSTVSGASTDTIIYIQRTKFKQNQIIAGDGGGVAKGGAMYSSGQRKIVFENCLFNGNKVESTSWSDSWGSYNSNGEGGAVRIETDDRYTGSGYIPYNPVIFINNSFINNLANGSGNNSGQGGAIYFDWSENSVMINNVFWGNSVNNNTDSTRNELNLNDESSFDFSNNAFQYFDGSSYGNDNKIGVDPAFDSSNIYPYSLHDRSQLIGAGIASLSVGSYTYSAPSDDINKNSRPSPSGSSPDIGAYENALGASPYPTNVSGISATVANQQVTLSWSLNTESDMASYKIYQGRTSGFSTSTDSLVATVSQPSSGTTATTTLTGLTNKTNYYFLITAVDSDGYEGSPSTEVSAMPYYKGPTWYVATSENSGSDSNEGSSSAPFLSVKMAVDSASTGDTISIGTGTHQYTSSSYWNISFTGSKSIIIKGQGKSSTVLDAQSKDRHFYFGMGTAAIDTNFKIMDLTLKNGKPSSNGRGGAVYINGHWGGSSWSTSGPLFQNVNFESNMAKAGTDEWSESAGGAVYIEAWAAPHFRNVEFNYNINQGRGGAVFKNGDWSNRGNSATFENCTFNGNQSDAGAYQWQGAGGAVFTHGPLTFNSCTFDSNKVISNSNNNGLGGAVSVNIQYSNQNSDRIDVQFNNCTFSNNQNVPGNNGGNTAYGGALYLEGRTTAIVTNSLFYGNKAEGGVSVQQWGTNYNEGRGGAINVTLAREWNNSTNSYEHQGEFVMINTTIADNESKGASNNGFGGGLMLDSDQKAFLFNNVIWGNAGNSSRDSEKSIYYFSDNNNDFRWSNNSIQNFDASSFGNNNVKTNPEFVGSGTTPYALHDRSALIGAGTLSHEGYDAPTTDITGVASSRPNPSGSNPDLGAYENSLSKTPYPTQVAGLKAKGGDGSVALSWTANSESDIAKYYIYRHTASFTASSKYLIDSVTTTTHTSFGLNNATRYYFSVSAVNSSGYEGASSSSINITPSYTGPVWYMAVADSGGSDSNEGSEASPLLSLTKAVEKSATGDTILIGDGTYTGSENREVIIYGSKKLVIQSINGKDKTIFDAAGFGRHLVLNITDASNSIDSTFVIEGITFKNGGGSNTEGGSIRVIGYNGWNQTTQQNVTVFASPKFKNCAFYGNNASWYGGAAYIRDASPIFESCSFDSNSVDGTESSNQGGAVYVSHGSPEFRNSSFNKNKAYDNGSIYYGVEGGAIYFNGPNFAKIINCTFSNNQAYSKTASPSGGAIYIGDDYEPTDNEQLIIDRSTFYGNTNEAFDGGNNRGGALYIRGGIKITNSLFYDNHVYTGGNGFWPGGGAISFEIHGRYNQNTNQQEYPKTYLINNTIVDNSIEYNVGANAGKVVGSGGGINSYSINSLQGVWFNNIIWNNESEANKDMEWDNQTPLIFGHNVVEDIYSGIPITEILYSKDPKFTDTTNHVYTLSDASYLIGKGVSSYDGIYAPSNDIDGNSRPSPSGSSPDMGAYEHSLSASPYPSQVTGLKAKGSHRYVTLGWDANAETDIASYTVYMSTNSEFVPSSTDSIASVTTNNYTTGDSLINKQEYYFAITAVNEKGNMGAHSEIVMGLPRYHGPNWYVSVDGNNDADGDAVSPFADLRTAIDSAKSGNTIILMAGIHTGPGNRNIRLDTGKPLYIYGDLSAGAGEVILDAENSGNHFEVIGGYDSTLVFNKITFTRGSGFHDGDQAEGGSIRLQGREYWDNEKELDIYENPSPRFIDCIWTENNAFGNIWGRGGAIQMTNASPVFIRCTFKNNSSKTQGGAIMVGSNLDLNHSNPKFINTLFKWNSVNSQTETAWGGAVSISGGTSIGEFIQCRFESNVVRSQDNNADGGAVQMFDWSEEMTKFTKFDQCTFVNNYAESINDGANGGAISAESPITMVNSLVVGNQGKGSHGGGGGLSLRIHDKDGNVGQSVLINNTIFGNEFRDRNGNYAHGGGGIMAAGASNQGGLWFNNIIYGNRSGNDNSILKDEGANIDMAYLNVDDEEGKSWFDALTMITDKPKFKNPGGEDYRLSFSSTLVNAGADSYGGENAPKVDIRNYYRLETTDIGAYEFGASKYILELADDISPIERDTTYLSRDQEFKITIKTYDNQNQIVTDEESLNWFISPTDKHVTIVEGDTVTSNGEASVKVKATGITGFKFRVGVNISDAVRVTDLYIIERQVTGAPPPVTAITISPDDWTNQNQYSISWTNPDEGTYGRQFLGAVVKLGDDYPEYINRTSETQFDVNSANVKVPEMGEWQFKVWLVDELGNDSEDSAMVVIAKFDEQPPDEFNIHWPNDGSWVSDKPQFRWESAGDYPSGIQLWTIYLNDNEYGTYDNSQVTFDGNNNEIYIEAETSIPDGYHSWYMEIRDMAGNVQRSNDTINFGVDVTPPMINHNSPLGTIDAGSTTPTINVNINDSASGVKYANLHYRRSGSGGGFVTVDLMSGPVSIPGSDVKEDGLEYWIDAEDNVGNYDAWPGIGELHAVSVRSEGSISTADNWSSGIPGGTDSTNYLFFSIPFEVGNAKNAITSIMGPADEFMYRLFSYNNGWQEDPPSVTMGNAYFFIFDPDKYEAEGMPTKIEFNFGQGVSTPTEPPYGFGVSAGQWKFFGSPYNYNVSLDNVYTESGENIRDAGSIYTWSGSWRSAGSSLQPWKGYIFKSGGATKLNIDARGSGFGKMAKSINIDDYPMDADEWIIDMIATTGNARDELNAVGVRQMAEDGYDRLDEFEPPAVMGDIVLRIDNRDRVETPDLYAKDIRKPNEAGHYWDLQVFAPTNGQRTYLTFDGLGYIPEEYDVFLINKTTKQAKNLEWESRYRFANTGSDDYLKQDFRLVIGTKDFVNENNAGVNLYPDAFQLSQNFPNPFNPQTSIMISMEEDAQLDLTIFNLLGEEVTRLAINEHRPAGYYTFIWNGTNTMGSKVSTGVYFYHAMIRNTQGKVVLNKTRKMIFLK